MRSNLTALVSVLVLAVAGPALAQPSVPDAGAVQGPATVLSSDTVAVGGRLFRLDGVDGVEFHQTCFVGGRPWACGASAIRALQTLVDPVEVSCTPAGPAEGEVVPAECRAGGLDIAELMAADGWALAPEGSRYAGIAAAARAAGKGVWASAFVEPWAYRAHIAAVEERYLAGVAEALRGEAERAMTDRDNWVYVLEGFDIVDAPADAAPAGRRVRVPDLAPGFVEASIEEREVFSWSTVTRKLEAWQQTGVATIKADAVGLLWTALQARPRRDVDVFDALGYLNAMRSNAAPWIAAGRQPVLLVRSPLVPSWMRLWFGDEPPPRASVLRKTAIDAPGYLGTIDGIDIYVGSVPDDASALLPADLLQQVAYGRHADGHVLAVSREARPEGDELVAAYSVGFTWRDDTVVWLKYPRAETEVLVER